MLVITRLETHEKGKSCDKCVKLAQATLQVIGKYYYDHTFSCITHLPLNLREFKAKEIELIEKYENQLPETSFNSSSDEDVPDDESDDLDFEY